MNDPRFQLDDIHRRRAELLGEEGLAWIDSLPVLISELESRWRIEIREQLSGGTEALVFMADTTRGTKVVLKLGQPGSLTCEIRALQLADGVGYAKLLECDAANNVLLLEGLGSKLIDSPLPADEQLSVLLHTVQQAWRTVEDPTGLMTGAEKARWHFDWMQTQWSELGRPCPRALIDRGLAFAEAREAAYDPASSLLVHGDSHAWNTLEVPGDPGVYKMVDPDGYFMEPAYDLSISLREWIDELYKQGDPLSAGKARCDLLAARTGVHDEAIWQWGFIEHVSTGLVYTQLQDPDSARRHYEVAEAWLAG